MVKRTVQKYRNNEVVTFDGESLNEGGYFLKKYSSFWCQQSGIYFVSVNLKKNDTINMSVIVKVGSTTVSSLSCLKHSRPYSTTSKTILVKCVTGR